MKLEYFNEPLLHFAAGRHVCPRKGIAAYGVFDRDTPSRNPMVNVGAVGTGFCLQKFRDWIDLCAGRIGGPESARQPRLFPAFPGTRADGAFYTNFHHGNDLARQIPQREVGRIVGIDKRADRISMSVELFYEHIAFLTENRDVDVIVCIVPDQLFDAVAGSGDVGADEMQPDDDSGERASVDETNFRRALKARALHLACPLQLVRELTFDSDTPTQQDKATKAWNLWTALYYKSGPKVPWRIPRYDGSPHTSCAIGIAFYQSRDRKELQTSLAQVFDEMGTGIILRGTPVEIGKHDRVPKLSREQAHDLVLKALNEYHVALHSYPARVVVHKSAKFRQDEREGIVAAAEKCGVQMMDFVTLLPSNVHLYRSGNYPPYRGTVLHLDDHRHVLYTRGSVWYYQTYPGLYIPRPIEYRLVKCDSSPAAIGREILALTKLNWNNTRIDGKYPITLGCARVVGEILKYVSEDEVPPSRYAYYM